ncbi:hypothetical protein [Streptomyces sp. NPDC102462]|uniref:hypothetical protein n=1 Tax=Streptomyces sp. NPDC102462 TaxID=3366178 RepID=UPI0037F65C95
MLGTGIGLALGACGRAGEAAPGAAERTSTAQTRSVTPTATSSSSSSSPSASATPTADPALALPVSPRGSFEVRNQGGARYSIALATGPLQNARQGVSVAAPGSGGPFTDSEPPETVVLGSFCHDVDYATDAVLPLTVTVNRKGEQNVPGLDLEVNAGAGTPLPSGVRAELETRGFCDPSGQDGLGRTVSVFEPFLSGDVRTDTLPALLILKKYRSDPAKFRDVRFDLVPQNGYGESGLPRISDVKGMERDTYVSILGETLTRGAQIHVARRTG